MSDGDVVTVRPDGTTVSVYEPALSSEPHESRGAAVTDRGSLPAVLLAKLDALRLAGKP